MNYAVLSLAASILFTALIYKVYGLKACCLYLLEALGSIFYLEAINYI